MQDEKDRCKAKTGDTKNDIKKLLELDDDSDDENAEVAEKFLKAARTLERMVTQNIYCDIALGKIVRYFN